MNVSKIYLIGQNLDNISESKSVWHYDQKNEIFSSIQTRNGESRMTNYDVTGHLGNGNFGVVKTLKPRENRKLKAVKYSDTSMKCEFEISLKWPKKSIGLLIRPEAYFPSTESGMPNVMVMHKYDGKLTDFYPQMNGEKKLEAVCQISQGIATLYDLHILHHDLYFDNILHDKRMNRYDVADFGIALVDDKNFEQGCVNEAENLIQLIDTIFFKSKGATLTAREAKNLLAKIFGEKEVTIGEYERMRHNILQEQGYSSKLAQQILDFLAHPPNKC